MHYMTFLTAICMLNRRLISGYIRYFISEIIDNPFVFLEDIKISAHKIYLLDFIVARIRYVDISKGRFDKIKRCDREKQIKHCKSALYLTHMEIYDNKLRYCSAINDFQKEFICSTHSASKRIY